jgi:iron complex transport system substrate-binding protein
LKSYLADSVGAPIEILGIPVIYVDFETPKQYTRDLAIFGKVFQDEKRASELIEFYQAKVRQIEEAVQDAPKTCTLILSYNEKDGNVAFSVPPTGWIQTQMTQVAGGEPIWVNASLGDGWTQVSLEQIAVWDADQIFIISYFAPAEDVVESLKVDANWQGLRAVQEENLYAFPSDMYSWGQPDTRWILGLTWQAEKMHPELFPNHDMTQETQTFYETLYGLDATFYTEHLLPLLRAD